MTEHKEKYWSKFACTYGDDQNYVFGKTILQLIIKRLSEEHDLGEVIEFGCGTGYFTKAIAKKARNVIASGLHKSRGRCNGGRFEVKTERIAPNPLEKQIKRRANFLFKTSLNKKLAKK